MQALTLDGLDVRLSRIAFGCMQLVPEQAERNAALLDAYRALGGNVFDTAEAYDNGRSETALGDYFHCASGRNSAVVISKGCVEPKLVRPDYIRQAIDSSLARLRMDALDLYLLHRDDPRVPVAELVDVLNEAVRAGKIRAFGASNWSIRRIGEANEYAAKHSLQGFRLSSPHVSLLEPREPWWAGCTHATEQDLNWYRDQRIVVLGWSPQGRGFFDQQSPPDAAYLADLIRVYYGKDNLEKRRRLLQLAERLHCTPGQLAVAYVLGLDAPTIALFGPRSVADVQNVMAARDIEVTQADRKWLALA
jgi:aryl-alcohol dehydrogenase-like predicted oxidoreductase